jgi:cytochrome P450
LCPLVDNNQIILPNRFADEIRARDEFNFPKSVQEDLFTTYPGFDAFTHGLKNDWFLQEVTRVKLSQSLSAVTPVLVDETTAAVHDLFGEDYEWQPTLLKSNVAELIGRLSSRVFLGLPLCRNKRWLDITKSYTVDVFAGSSLLRESPAILRPIMYWFNPHCTRLRAQVRDARSLITPEIKKRIAPVQKALAAGQKPPKMTDMIGWMHEVARGEKVDYVAMHLNLSVVAMHTTTENTAQALIDICRHPEIVGPLREEIISVISENGWTKASLQKLRLMDSFLKESQRFTPIAAYAMHRYVERKFELSDGTVLPKGAKVIVAGGYTDPAVYENPEKFDAFRFARKRPEPGQTNAWGHVTTSASHMGFGHGQHACPGRFFASNEIKVALCHILLKYDLDLLDGEAPPAYRIEGMSSVSLEGKIRIRRRKKEINLDLEEPL